MIELADVTVIVVGFATLPAAVLNAMAPALSTYAAVATAECDGVPAPPVLTHPCAFNVVETVNAGIAVVATIVPAVHEAPSLAHAGAVDPSVV